MAINKRKPNPVHTVTTGTVLRLEQPKSKRKPKPNTAVVVAKEINPVGGFSGFLKEYSVITLAVGFAIATQAQAVVKQLITSFLDPLYGLLYNGQKLSSKSIILHYHGRPATLAWGAFVYTLIDFLFVLLVIFWAIRFFNLDKLAKEKDEDK